MRKTTLAGAAAVALTFGGFGAAVAQAKAPAHSHALAHKSRAAAKAGVSRDASDAYGSYTADGDGTGQPNILDWIDLGPSETGLPSFGLITDLLEGL
jgi:hypothetical protein